MSADDPDLAAVIAAELRLLEPGVRAVPEEAGELLDPEFREFGASGRVWDRVTILAMMAGEPLGTPPTVDQMRAVRLADDVVLLTYRTQGPARRAVRSSIWRRHGGRWRVVFHQGTVQPPSLPD